MRLTTVLLIASLMQVSAAGFAQKISLSTKNASLSQVFKKIKSQAGVDFFISSELLKQSKSVTIEVKNTELSEVLDRIFKDQPLAYAIEDKFVVVSKKEPAFIDNVIARFRTIDVRGRVVDSTGRALAGASVRVKNGKGSATTNANGEFYLPNVEDGVLVLISYIGYQTSETKASSKMLNIVLQISDSKLDEVQVIAYGVTTQRYTTGNTATIKSEVITKQPVLNPLLSLQGRVPGLFIQQVSGVSGSNLNIKIQGINSLGNRSDPLFVVDGVPYSPQFNFSLADGAFTSSGGSTFNFVNPADIESISILKDADATAIYGSRAANGAILITTKKGKPGKTKIDINLQNGWGQPNRKLDYLNTQQYLEMRKEAYINAGQAIPTSATNPTSSNYDLTIWDQNKYTDWQEELVRNTASFTNLQASISGGSNNTQFLAAYGFNKQNTVYPGDLEDIKGNVHFNLNHNSTDAKFRYNISATYLQDKNTLGNFDLMDQAVRLTPNAPSLYNADQSLNWEPFPKNPAKYSFNNPLAYIERKYTGNTSNLTASNDISYEVLSGLQMKANMGFNRLGGQETQINPLTAIKPDALDQTRTANFLNKSISSWIIEPQITYTKEMQYGTIDALIGSTFQQMSGDLTSQTGTGYSNDSQLGSLLAAFSTTTNLVEKTLYKYNALFGRFNYRLENKYIINFTARRDGSSRFGDQNKLHTFYAVGGAWLFGEEKIFKNNLAWVSSGKIRASYGTTGNDQILDYRYLSLLVNYGVDIPYGQSVGLVQSSIANPFLQWEETRKINLGLDLGFVKDRISLSLNYYRNRSSNQLIGYILPNITGFGSVDQNFPATVQNKGLEGQLTLNVVKSKDFNWHSDLNITVQKNKLIDFPGLSTSSYANDYILGQPINIFRAYKFSGVNSTTGLYQFIDHDGKTTSDPDPTLDKTVLIDPNPKFFGGFSNTLQYKGFDLDFVFQFVNQKAKNYKFGNLAGAALRNQPTSILNRWKKPGDMSDIQKVSSNVSEISGPLNAANASDEAYVGASYIRLKNISLSYSLPKEWSNKVKLYQTRIYLQAQNLLTFTKFIGSDPETAAVGVLPPLRIITAGLQINL